MTDGDPGMAAWFRDSHAYAVFPDVGKAGFGIGAARGDGIAYLGGAPVGKTQLSAVRIGLLRRFEAGLIPRPRHQCSFQAK